MAACFAAYADVTFAVFLTMAFLRVAFFVAGAAAFSFAAFTAAQRFRLASPIACLPASLICRFALAGTVTSVDGAISPLILAHLSR